jgi:hypothetical protein
MTHPINFIFRGHPVLHPGGRHHLALRYQLQGPSIQYDPTIRVAKAMYENLDRNPTRPINFMILVMRYQLQELSIQYDPTIRVAKAMYANLDRNPTHPINFIIRDHSLFHPGGRHFASVSALLQTPESQCDRIIQAVKVMYANLDKMFPGWE